MDMWKGASLGAVSIQDLNLSPCLTTHDIFQRQVWLHLRSCSAYTMLFVAKQAAKHERRRQFQAAERERKSKNKTAAELAQEQRELQVQQQLEVCLVATSMLPTTHKSAVVRHKLFILCTPTQNGSADTRSKPSCHYVPELSVPESQSVTAQ